MAVISSLEAHLPLWIGLAGFVAVQWLVRLLAMTAAARRRRILRPDSYRSPLSQAPSLSVLVAAKDEENNIESCLSSLLKQDYPDFELIVIDDRSEDRTPMIVRRLQRRSAGRLRLVTVLTLPKGWIGKNNAMHVGIRESRGDWLCFIDADCRQTSPRSLSIAMQEALNRQADLLTITPVLEMETFWEKLTHPACAQTMLFWFRPDRVNDQSKPTAYANGQFMLMTRCCYDAVGGHERVKSALNEDIDLARNVKNAGFTLQVVENEGLYRTRMYRSFADAYRGWSRIFFGSLQSSRRIAVSMFANGFFGVVPWLCLAVSWLGWLQSDSYASAQWLQSSAAWLCAVLLSHLVAWRFYRFLDIHPLWSLTYPVGALATFAMLFCALLRQLGLLSTTWRGTTYHAEARVETAAEDW